MEAALVQKQAEYEHVNQVIQKMSVILANGERDVELREKKNNEEVMATEQELKRIEREIE